MGVSRLSIVVVIAMVAAMACGCAMMGEQQPAAEEEIRVALEDYHAAMIKGDVERALAALSDEGGNKARIRRSFEGPGAQGLLAKSTISLKECKITVKGSTAIAKPVIYETPLGRSVHEYQLQKEGDGVWRIISSEKRAAKAKDSIWTAASEGDIAGIKRHIAAGADPGSLDPMNGNTPLQWSIMFGQLEAARLLVEIGVDVNAEGRDGSTALHTSAYFGPIELVKLLLENGADPHVPDRYYQTPLYIAEGPWDSKLEGLYRFVDGALKLKLDLEKIKAARPAIADLLRQYD